MTELARRPWCVPLALLLAALLIRGQTLGHPLLHMDENFYLLVGDRMVADGAWPYVDIWDRKPVGLFALFAAFAFIGRLLGGDGFIPYQIAALLAATATAWIIVKIASQGVSRLAAFVGGVFYLAGLTFFGGYGGQAPVFYNFLTGLAVLALMRCVGASEPGGTRSPAAVFRGGALCMLFVGLAIQIKSSVVFEGIFFGLVLLYAIRGAGMKTILGCALAWIGIAVAPTLLAWGIYVAAGHGEAFVFANFVSIFERTASFDGVAAKRLMSLLGLLSPLIILTVVACAGTRRFGAPFKVIQLGWLATAIAGLMMLGTFYNHYGLPLLLPLSVTAAMGLSVLRLGQRALAGVLLIALAAGGIGTYVKLSRKGDAADVAHILAYLPPQMAGCPWLMGTLGATLYLKSGACLPTRFPLSGHLFERQEEHAIGVNQDAEIASILAARPPVITMDEEPRPEENMEKRARFITGLKTDYRLAEVREAGKSGVMVFVRRQGGR